MQEGQGSALDPSGDRHALACRKPLRAAALRTPNDINHVIAYGQSLASGWEGWPPLSTKPRNDNLMLGASVRPSSESVPYWSPVGPALFQPLIATAQNVHTGAILTPAEYQSLTEPDPTLGETILEGALNFWRARQLAGSHAQRFAHRLLASSCGVGGRTIEQLSRGATPNLFQRLTDCTSIARAVAAGQGLRYGVTALLFLQGEHNVHALNGGTADRAEYKRLLLRLHDDFAAEAAPGQPNPPMFLYQTSSAPYANDSNSIAQAQLEAALETPGIIMAAPSYPVTTKGGHLDANGYRWLGNQFGKILHRTLTLDQPFHPLHPTALRADGNTLTITFHVPAPPLRWGRPARDQTLWDAPDKGFSVTDPTGTIPIVAAEITTPTTVRLTLSRPPAANAILRYGDRNHGGSGCLHDSDPEIALDHFQGPHIPEHDGRPYPLMNWCALFALPLPASTTPNVLAGFMDLLHR